MYGAQAADDAMDVDDEAMRELAHRNNPRYTMCLSYGGVLGIMPVYAHFKHLTLHTHTHTNSRSAAAKIGEDLNKRAQEAAQIIARVRLRQYAERV